MVDKDKKDNQGFNIDDDFELEHDTEDDFEFSEDELLLSEDENLLEPDDGYHIEDSSDAMHLGHANSSGIMGFVKSYGIVIAVGLVFIYFGYSYLMGLLFAPGSSSAAVASKPAVAALTPANGTKSNQAMPDLVGTPKPSTSEATQEAGLDEQLTLPPVDSSKSANVSMPLNTTPPKDFDPLSAIAPNQPSTKKSDNQDLLDLTGVKHVTELSPSSQDSQINATDTRLDALAKSIDTINNKLKDQEQTGTLTTKDLADLKTQIKANNTQISQIMMYTQGVSKSLGILAEQLRKQQEVLQSIAAKNLNMTSSVDSTSVQPGSSTSASATSSVKPTSVVILEAVIAGRAWLKVNNGGPQLSVSYGDTIPGYGKVIAINPKEGSVTTDTGMVFKY